MTKERNQLASLIKAWAQDHNQNWQIDNSNLTDSGMKSASSAFDWVIKNGYTSIDLLSLLNSLENFLQEQKKNSSDGMYCKGCNQFISLAEPNQDDGSLICYSCRQNPYI